MSMNKTLFLKKEERIPGWRIIDAEGQTLGRLATQIAEILRGKDKPYFTPHTDCGDYVVVINAEKVHLTGNKWKDKIYDRYTGYIGGYKVTSAKEMLQKHPTRIIEHAVKGMLPKNILSGQVFSKLRVYVGDKHPHAAHNPVEHKIAQN